MAAWLVFTVVFAVYAWTASPAIGWLDAPEFVAASTTLGVPHSPGHPLPALLGRAAGLLPIGSLPFRVNLASSLAGAAAATALYAAARSALAGAAPEALRGGARDLMAAGCALVFAFSVAAWGQGVRAEVYALQAMLCFGALAAALAFDRGGEARWLALAGLFGGLALANHHFIALTVLVPAAVFVLARRPGARAVAICAACGALGLAAFLYLPVRSAEHPAVNWGAPHTAERFAWTVSGSAFQKTAGADRVSSHTEDAVQVVASLAEGVTLPVALLALFGLAAGLGRPGWRRGAALLGAVALLGAGGRVLLGFDPETPDHHAYLLPALGAIALLGALGLALLCRALVRARSVSHRGAGALTALALVLVAPVQLAAGAREASLRGAWASEEVARWELAALPPRALGLVSYFQTSFRLSALRAVEGARPDLDLLDRGFLTYPGAAEEAARRHPELAPLIEAPLHADAPTPIEALRRRAETRPVALQLHPNVDAPAERWLVPVGAFARFAPSPPGPRLRARMETADAQARAALAAAIDAAPPAERLQANLAALWYDAERLRFYCSRGRRRAAQRALERAWSAFPGDVSLRELAERCRLRLPK